MSSLSGIKISRLEHILGPNFCCQPKRFGGVDIRLNRSLDAHSSTPRPTGGATEQWGAYSSTQGLPAMLQGSRAPIASHLGPPVVLQGSRALIIAHLGLPA